MPKFQISAVGSRGVVDASPRWDFRSMELARGFPGRSRMLDGRLFFEMTPENIAYAKAQFGEVANAQGQGANAQGQGANAIVDRPHFQTAMPPTELQIEALSRSRNKLTFAFFEKPGSGKTKILLDHLVRSWCDNMIDCALIVAPNFVHEQWVEEQIPLHVHKSIPVVAGFWKPGKKWREPLVLKPNPDKLRILTVGYESYNSNTFIEVRDQFVASGRCAAVLDESHRIKTPTSKVSKILNKQADRYTARYIASGEPTPLGLQDYYAQYRFLSPRILNCFSFQGFKGNYCQMGGFERRQIVGYRNADKLHELAAPYTHVGAPKIDAEQIWHDPWSYSLHPKTKAIYDEMRRDLLVELEDGRIADAGSQLAAIVRLQQICLGRLVMEDGSIERLPDPRPDVLKEIMRGIDGKVVIWNEFLDDIWVQKELFGDKAVVIAGPVPREARQEAKSSFLHPKGAQFLLATPGAAGTGLNLHGSCYHNIYYSQKDNAGLRWQSERRTYRLGIDRDVHYHDIVARGTVDVAVQRRNRQKRDTAAMSFAEFRDIIEGRL